MSYQTHTRSHAGDADFLSNSSSTAALVLRSASARWSSQVNQCRESLPRSPDECLFSLKKKKKSPYEFYLSPQLLIIHKLQCAKILLLMLLLSASSSSPPLPHPLLHLGDMKKLQPLTSPQTLRSSNRDRRRPGPGRTPLSATEEQRPVRLTEALQHCPSSNQAGASRKRTFSGHHLQNNNKRSAAEFHIGLDSNDTFQHSLFN